MIALAQDEFRMGDLQVLVKFGPWRSLNTMIRPENLRPIRDLDDLIRLSPGMCGGERRVPSRVPILSQQYMLETAGKPVDQRYDLIAARDAESGSRTEIVLNVDHKQDIARPN